MHIVWPSISDRCGLCKVIGLVMLIEAGGLNSKIEPPLGVTEKPRSAMADSKPLQGIEPLASDFKNSLEKSAAVAALTLNCCAGSVTTICGVSGGAVIV